MILKDVVKVRESSADGVKIPWDETNEVGFIVKYCGKDSITKARKASSVKKLNPKTHQYEDNLDDEKFDYAIMNSTITGWWGLKGKHLKEILDPRVDVSEIAPEEIVEFTPENLDFIIKNYNLTFSRFVSGASLDIEVYNAHQEETEIKN